MSKPKKIALPIKRSNCKAVRKFYDDWDSDVCLLIGGVGTGKSAYSMTKLMMSPIHLGVEREVPGHGMCKYIGALIIRESEEAFKASVLPLLREIYPTEIQVKALGTAGTHFILSYFHESVKCVLEVRVIGLSHPAAFNKVRGGTFSVVVLNEIGPLEGCEERCQVSAYPIEPQQEPRQVPNSGRQ